MKKKLWMLGLVIVGLTSCTQSEVVDVPDGKIVGFDSFVGKSSRGLVEETTNNFKYMYIFGYKAGPDKTFTKTNSNPNYDKVFNTDDDCVKAERVSGEWNYTPLAYWQPATKYRFAAYATSNESEKIEGISYDPTNDNDKLKIISNVNNQTTDLVVAISGDRETHDPLTQQDVAKIPFTFTHAYSRVRFTFTDASNVNLRVKNLEIINASHFGEGSYSFNNTHDGVGDVVWTSNYDTGNTGYTYAEKIDLPAASNVSEELLVIPQNLYGKDESNEVVTDANGTITSDKTRDNVKVKFTLVTYSVHTEGSQSHEDVIREIPIELPLASGNYTQWESGRVYNYHMTFGSNYNEVQISFTVSSFYNWDSNLDGNANTEGDHIDLIYDGIVDDDLGDTGEDEESGDGGEES